MDELNLISMINESIDLRLKKSKNIPENIESYGCELLNLKNRAETDK